MKQRQLKIFAFFNSCPVLRVVYEGLHREEAGVHRAKGEGEADFPQLRQDVVPVVARIIEASSLRSFYRKGRAAQFSKETLAEEEGEGILFGIEII